VQVDATTDRGWKTLSSVRDNALLSGKPFVVQVVQAKRTLDQNAISHAIYTQIASQLEDQTVQEVRAECKLRFGIPILRAGNPDFKAMYDKAIRATLDYEEKLKAMEFLPVTRLMDKAQFSEYLDTVIREYSKQGVSILMPGEE
jgi:hypothetical protein